MSLMISRLRQHLPAVLFKQSVRSNVADFYFVTSTIFTRHFSRQVEINQRKLPADYDPVTFDPTEHRSPPSERVWRLVDEVSGLTLVEVTEVSSIIMKRLGMTERPTVGVMKPGAAGLAAAMKGPEAAKEEKKLEKTVFELKLESYESAQKIKIIKEVCSSTIWDSRKRRT
ncbi:hypothetical protein RDI58_027706 [Solanum bulbocastanum]|uniref:Uncharacterized protein n=1 Tax=Solanum bulbocastanum TaxID=147425 RepID=A0AAN8SVY2_SOLBU